MKTLVLVLACALFSASPAARRPPADAPPPAPAAPSASPSEGQGPAQLVPARPPVAGDVALVAALAESVARAPAEREAMVAALAPSFADALLRGAEQVLRASGVQDLEQARWEELKPAVASEIRKILRELPEGGRRGPALAALMRRVTTRQAATEVLDRWFGLEPLGVESGGTSGGAWGPHLPAQLAVGVYGGSEVRLDPGRSAVLAELGDGSRAGNGLLDAGEWVQLGLALHNGSSSSWFSTSARLEDRSGCLWVDSTEAHEAPELAPGKSGPIAFWVFLSAECAAAPRRLLVRLCDSNRLSSETTLYADLSPVDTGPLRLTNSRVDCDSCGSSDGTRLAFVRPGARLELADDVAIGSPQGVRARVSYRPPEEVKGIFERFVVREEPMTPDGAVLRAGDDLDAVVVPDEVYSRVLAGATALSRWTGPTGSGRVWLAVDVTLTRPFAGAQVPAGTSAPSPAPTPVPAATVLEIARRHVRIEPRVLAPTRPESAQTVAGYELIIDAAGFTKEYEAKITPVDVAPFSLPPLEYRHRFYRSLVVARPAASEVAARRTDASFEGVAPVPTAAAPASALNRFVRVDAGLLLSYRAVTPPAGTTMLDGVDGLVPLGGGARLFLGRRLAGVVELDYGVAKITGVTGAVRGVYSELNGAAGVGANFGAAAKLELSPRALLHLRGRSLQGSALTQNALTPSASIGGTARYFVTETIGAFVDASFMLGIGAAADPDLEGIQASTARASAGLSLRW